MKYILIFFLIVLSLWAEAIPIVNFQTNLFSRNSQNLKKISMDLVIETNESVATYKIKDGLNIVISSFFIEDLFTSQVKEEFKELLKSYVKQKEGIDIKKIYIEKMEIENQVDLDELVKKIDAKNKKIK